MNDEAGASIRFDDDDADDGAASASAASSQRSGASGASSTPGGDDDDDDEPLFLDDDDDSGGNGAAGGEAKVAKAAPPPPDETVPILPRILSVSVTLHNSRLTVFCQTTCDMRGLVCVVCTTGASHGPLTVLFKPLVHRPRCPQAAATGVYVCVYVDVCVCVLAALCASIQPGMFAASMLTLSHVTHNHAGTTVPALCAWWGAPDFLGCVPAGRSIGTPACCAPGRFLRSSVTTTHNVHDAAAAATGGALTWLPLCCTLAAPDWLARWRTAHTALGGVVPRQRLGR